MMIWQLLQVQVLSSGRAMRCFRSRRALINPEDVDIPVCVSNADEAIEIIRRHKEGQAL
jgi:hypothetical protein